VVVWQVTNVNDRRTPKSPRLLVVALAVVTALALAGCTSGKNSNAEASSTPPPTSQSPATAGSGPSSMASPGATLTGVQAQIKQNWEAFFNGSTDAEKKVSLLQNGDQFRQAIEAQANSALAKSAGASVKDVAINGSQATVTYDVTLGGQAVLTGQQGQAVLEGGAWKVSDASFCQLLALENGGSTSGLPPACGAAGASSPPA
jgi:hypothetical protein